MSFWKSKQIKKTRKQHICEYCGAIIPVGNSCRNKVGTYEGDFNNYYLCERCVVFMDLYRDKSESELGSFVDDLYESNVLDCPGGCRKHNFREYNFKDNMQAIEIKCYDCETKWTVDLSLEKFLDYKEVRQDD